MAIWRDDIVKGLKNLNGVASLSDIYKELRRIRPLPHPISFDAIIRRELESNSSDSNAFKGKKDLFYSSKGLGGGIWGLRNILNDTPVASDTDISDGNSDPKRKYQTTYRILRDTKLARQLKSLHNYQCQICSESIKLSENKNYVEAHHIKPLGSPYNGKDTAGNIIVLCPNHHVMLDYGAIKIDLQIIKSHPKHKIDNSVVEYHNNEIFGKIVQ